MLLDRFFVDVSYIQHILYRPSLVALVENLYFKIQCHDFEYGGALMLLLSIIATATHVWIPQSHYEESSDGHNIELFQNESEAHAQTLLWVQAARTVLGILQQNAIVTTETVQGIATLSFLVCNMEGISQGYRYLISIALFLGRELGLHCLDYDSSETHDDSTRRIQLEIERRLWWYLVATDWYVANFVTRC